MQRKLDPIVGIACSDIHLSLKPPLARSQEPDWLNAMRKTIKQLSNLAKKHSAPILCAGDIFNTWYAPAEMINWALEHLPHMYSIPGNHDLPNHRHELSHKSAYGTLVRAKKLTEVGPEGTGVGELLLYGFPFGAKIIKPRTNTLALSIALVHEYLWVPGKSYHTAPKESRLGKVAKKFRGYDVAVIGDNHMGFKRTLKSGTRIVNCGTLMRRKSDEFDYEPTVGLIHRSGKVEMRKLRTRGESLVQTEKKEEKGHEDISKFVQRLNRMEASSLSFREVMGRAMHKVKPTVRDILTEAME